VHVTESTNNAALNPTPSTSTLGTYSPHTFEPHWSRTWEKLDVGAPGTGDDTFTMVIPPPNVTGSLHMGHGFQLTLMDTIVRYQRMIGKNVRWVVGTDHAGIATQMVVERQLEASGITRKAMGREAFVQAVWAWKETSGTTITQQMRRLGISVDWSDERFTMDEGCNKAVCDTFVTLYKRGLIYRGTKLVYWDTVLQTAVSDLEVETHARHGHLWHIAYELKEHTDTITIATTRPETMFGDTAIAVHPEDPRYTHLIGQEARIPYTDIYIPIIADTSIEHTFGSGAVKITPAHDHFDYALGLKHHLPCRNIMFPDGRMNVPFAEDFHTLDRFVVRKKLIEQLTNDNKIIHIEPHTSHVPCGDRSHSILEPYLTPQWYLKTDKIAQLALEKVLDGTMRLVPEYWVNTYRHWLENPQDWCISRQLWWGHRIPAWYDIEGNIYVGIDEESVRREHALDASCVLTQEEDVLDTWFSAALWPLMTLGYYDNADNFHQRHPTDLLVTGFDILFFWVARMSMMSLELTQSVPFKDVLVTGLIRDAQGQKMSKSKGNVLDPIYLIEGVDLETLIASRTTGLMQPKMRDKIIHNTRKEFPQGIESHGADALRMVFCALHNTGQDIRFDRERLLGFRNFCNKVWNVARLIEHRLETIAPQKGPMGVYDIWLIQSFNVMITSFHDAMASYRFDLAAQTLQDWIWLTWCDWYCEISKVLMERDGPHALHNLITLFDQVLCAAHPMMPFITEELGKYTQNILHIERSCVALSAYPRAYQNTEDTSHVDCLIEIITAVRSIRSMLEMSPKTLLDIYLPAKMKHIDFIVQEKDMWSKIGKIAAIHFTEPTIRCASKILSDLTLMRVAIDSVDPIKERTRLHGRLVKLHKEHDKLVEKMAQQHYKDKAPESIQQADNELYQFQRSQIESYTHLLHALAS